MDNLPHNVRELCPYSSHEEKVFWMLKGIDWVSHKTPPLKNLNLIPQSQAANTTTSRKPLQDGVERAHSDPPIDISPHVIAARLSPILSPPADFFASNAFLRSPTLNSIVEPVTTTPSRLENPKSQLPLKQSLHKPPKPRSSLSGSDYSDDLYGSGPLLHQTIKPINSKEKIREWRLSSLGNPQVTTPQDNTFVPSTALKHDGIALSVFELSAFLDSESHGSVMSERDDTALDKRPSALDDIADLVITDQTRSQVQTSSTTLVDTEAKSGDLLDPFEYAPTIVEDDASILADLNVAFVETEYRGAGLDYKCLSDDDTEVDSELDKIEYEFQSVRPLSRYLLGLQNDEMGGENNSCEMSDGIGRKCRDAMKSWAVDEVCEMSECEDHVVVGSRISQPCFV